MQIDLSQNALIVAPQLLNCNLCVVHHEIIVKKRITEVEAYHGFEDKASHAHKGKTARNQVMFGSHGYWYVYLCYGVHWLLNLVTGPEDYPSAVLIRGVEQHNGPGKLTKALEIDKRYNEVACHKKNGLWIESISKERILTADKIKSAPRIGIAYAGEEWASKPWRFYCS